jgi:DNA-binding transcriptional regulator YiaG
MSEDFFAGAVDWQPEFTPEQHAKVARLRDQFRSAASMFRRIRQELGLSQVQAAVRLSTTQANISKMEKRGTDDVSLLRRLAADSDYEVVVMLRGKHGQRDIVLTD